MLVHCCFSTHCIIYEMPGYTHTHTHTYIRTYIYTYMHTRAVNAICSLLCCQLLQVLAANTTLVLLVFCRTALCLHDKDVVAPLKPQNLWKRVQAEQRAWELDDFIAWVVHACWVFSQIAVHKYKGNKQERGFTETCLHSWLLRKDGDIVQSDCDCWSGK